MVGQQVIPFADGSWRIITGIEHADALSRLVQGGYADPRQIVSMNVITVAVFISPDQRQLAAEAALRQTVGSIDAGHAQDGQPTAMTQGKGAQIALGIDTTSGAIRSRLQWRALVQPVAIGIAVDAAGADIHDLLW